MPPKKKTPKITREIALRYNRFNEARHKAGVPPIGDPLDVIGLKTDTLSREPKGNGYAKKGFAKQASSKPAPSEPKKADPPNYAKGGRVKKTGMAKVHKGEVVLTAKQAKMMRKLF